MSQKSQSAKALTAMFALALLATACTKPREAELPYEMQKSVFAISEFGETEAEKSTFSIATDSDLSDLSLGNSSKATAEKGLVPLTEVQVPGRLKYMFSGLEITGLAARSYPVTFSVDKQFVTAYKIVTNPSELTILEKHLAQVQEEVVLKKQLQKNLDKSKAKTLLAALKKAQNAKASLLNQKSAPLLVPLFKYKVAKFGILEKQKNKLKEDTSTLELLETDWNTATHIILDTTKEGRLLVGLDPSQSGDLDRTFVMDRINNKIMTAETLTSEFQIPANLSPDTRVLTLLDVKALHVFEVTQLGKTDLTDSQMRQLQGGVDSNVRKCPADVVQTLPVETRKDCILVLRYDIDVTYVQPELPVVDYDGNQDAKVNFKPVLSNQNVGLVQIPKDVEPKKVESNNELDPSTTIRIADIKDKEFFFKRTLEDASYTAGFAPGRAGDITIVKFEFEENRLVLRNADKLVNFKTTTNQADYEEVMSLPVKYLKLETKDATGAKYSMPRLAPASRTDAQYVELDWTRNSIPQHFSPYASIYEGCILGTADSQVANVDMRLSSGVLNFSQKYTLALHPDCITEYETTNSYNGAPSYQYTARLTERISLKVNDHSTDTSFVPQVPFKAQNALSYGVWTVGQINPDINGQFGREGTEKNFPMVHDFRNGKTLVYTVTGLPTDDPELRKTLTGIVEELVASWNLAYQQAFKGSSMERSGPYITYQIAGENGVTAHLGDLDKNIFHFENKYANHGILGISQVGFNPRSAIVVADSLILYTGNVKSDVARNFEEMKLRAGWEKMKEGFREEARKKLKEEEEAEQKAVQAEKAGVQVPADEKAGIAQALGRQLVKIGKNKKSNALISKQTQNLGLALNQLTKSLAQRKALGGSSSFAYSSPKDESGWMDKVLRSMLAKPDMSVSEIKGAIAKEILAAKGHKLSVQDRASLSRVVKQGNLSEKMAASLKTSPGCMKTAAEAANGKYATLSFNEAFRIEALNTMAHEMGHSQGLTHNFIGSFDKANYANEDGTPSKRNYSSVMDYLTPGKFSWDGLGTYDIRAIRASHLGLLEVTPGFKTKLGEKASSVLVQNKFISVDTIRKAYAKNGWANFTKADVAGVLKPYKYCTDIDVGGDPLCQRHDFGSSVTEIVESLMNDWEDNYISNYHGWNRNSFTMADAFFGPAMSSYYMKRMRKFMDETFYKLILRNYTEDEIKDFMNATWKTYLFYTQLLNTPDTNSHFRSNNRFVAVRYTKKERDEKGQETGKQSTEIEVVEKRGLEYTYTPGSTTRIDTVGLEYDKIAAMKFLTLKGYPSSRYSSQNIEFSYLDYEKYLLGMTSEESLFVDTLTKMLLNQLQPTFSNNDVILQPLPNEKATVTSAMRSYAGIYGILNLESSSLTDKDNFANLFKVASSVGKAPEDRIALSPLGVSENSKTRVMYWALDNASAAQRILKVAATKNFFLQKMPEIQPLMEKLVQTQVALKFGMAPDQDKKVTDNEGAAELAKAKAALVEKLNTLNKNGEVVSPEVVKKAPNLSIENQIEGMIEYNDGVFTIIMALAKDAKDLKPETVAAFAEEANLLADALPLFALNQKAVVSTFAEMGKMFEGKKGFEGFAKLGQSAGRIMNDSSLETSYGIIMKNVEFLSLITTMTNPEYNR